MNYYDIKGHQILIQNNKCEKYLSACILLINKGIVLSIVDDYLEIDEIDEYYINSFKLLKKYYNFETIQKRNNAAKIIHKGCHNWLYAPVCKDNSIGIVPKLMLKKLWISNLFTLTVRCSHLAKILIRIYFYPFKYQ